MAEIFDTLLLLALPASGKSEVRTFLTAKNPEQFHMGPTIQLDDYPYVHLQLRIDEELDRLHQPRIYHIADDAEGRNGPFIDGYEWGALIRLLNEDYDEVLVGRSYPPDRAAHKLFALLDRASEDAGGTAKLRALPLAIRAHLADALEAEARELFKKKAAQCPADRTGQTIVIEFARGGPEGMTPPLPVPYGYAYSLAQLSPDILNRAAILYIKVTPEESRRKNRERARPDSQGSILFHGTPETVMRKEYGCDDMEHLLETAVVRDTVCIRSHGQEFHLPTAVFDNMPDKTSFLRKPEAEWTTEEIDAIQGGLKRACDRLWAAWLHVQELRAAPPAPAAEVPAAASADPTPPLAQE